MSFISNIINKIVKINKKEPNPLQESIDKKLLENSLKNKLNKRKRNGNKNNKNK